MQAQVFRVQPSGCRSDTGQLEGIASGHLKIGLYTPVNLLLVEDEGRVGRAATAAFTVDDGSQDFAIAGK